MDIPRAGVPDKAAEAGPMTCRSAAPARPRRTGRGGTRRSRSADRHHEAIPGVVANSDINITVRRGTVHALVGENGAGKSTLMKTLYGMHQPDEGTIAVDGKQVVFHSPADAIAVGIGMVHQHFMLADNLTVWENVVLGAEPMSGGRLDVRGARARSARSVSGTGSRSIPTRWSRTSGSATGSGWRSSRCCTAARRS